MRIDDFYTAPDSSDYSRASSCVRFKRITDNLKCEQLDVLDFGCGPGNMVEWLYTNNLIPKTYYGYDIRSETINVAKQKHPTYKFETCLPSNETFDLIVLAGTISYAFDPNIDLCKSVYAKEIATAMMFLKPYGVLRGTVRKVGFENEKKQNKRMLTYSETELINLGASLIESLFDHEWFFEIRKEEIK